MKSFYSQNNIAVACLIVIGVLGVSSKSNSDGYSKLFAEIHLDPLQYDNVYMMHFDFCSPVTKCNDTIKVSKFVSGGKHRSALIVDTLYGSGIPKYVKFDSKDIFFVNRTWLQRKGWYLEFQQKLIISRKGKMKRRILLR